MHGRLVDLFWFAVAPLLQQAALHELLVTFMGILNTLGFQTLVSCLSSELVAKAIKYGAQALYL